MTSPVSPEIEAEITLLSTECGGRDSAILSGEYRGVLSVGDENYSARFQVKNETGFSLSETQIVGVQFLFPDAALPFFPVGATFAVWEGRNIGHGKVIKRLKNA